MADRLYHIVDRREWEEQKALGRYAPDGYSAEGFLHMSTRSQIVATANRHFAGVPDLIVLVVDPTRLRADVAYERSATIGEDFPHLYGQLNLDAVIDELELPLSGDGSFAPPPELDSTA